jgi:DNA-packaging protein gp3
MAFVGRPKKFDNVEQLENLIEGYFDYCDNYAYKQKYIDKEGETKEKIIFSPKPYTVSGLCAFLGISRETLNDYSKKEEFSDTIKAAKIAIEAEKVEGATQGKYNATIVIFDLKNNFDWKDKTEVDNNHKGNISLHFNEQQGNDPINN